MDIVSAILLVVELTVGMVFLLSALGKTLHPFEFSSELRKYRLVPSSVTSGVAVVIIVAEFAVAATHLSGNYLGLGIVAGLGLLLIFSTAVGIALVRGYSVDCLCFGARSRQTVSSGSLVQLLFLMLCEIALGVSYLFGVEWVTPVQTEARLLVLALACAVLFMSFGVWALSVRSIYSVYRG